ncbi:hypothetical protein [Thermogymnomonas acidicola]|nr:hypothetical protein [Thermogymnomonas acidicola]
MIVTASYHVWAAQRALYGPYNENLGQIRDLGKGEFAITLSIMVVVFILGVYPNLIFPLFTHYVGSLSLAFMPLVQHTSGLGLKAASLILGRPGSI